MGERALIIFYLTMIDNFKAVLVSFIAPPLGKTVLHNFLSDLLSDVIYFYYSHENKLHANNKVKSICTNYLAICSVGSVAYITPLKPVYSVI